MKCIAKRACALGEEGSMFIRDPWPYRVGQLKCPLSWTCCWMCISIWSWPASQKWADSSRASSPVCLVCGVPWASVGPRPNSQTFSCLIAVPSWSPAETVHLRLRLEPTRPGLRPGQNPHWDSNPHCWYSNPAKTQTGTRTHAVGTQTRPKPTVFQLRSHIWFQDLMKLRFLMSHRRKNSVRGKVIGKK